MSKEIEVNGHWYRLGRLDARQQLHVSRRIAPIIATMGISLTQLRHGLQGVNLDDMVNSLGPMSEVVSNMSDEHVDYITSTCLSVVHRKEGDKWAPAATGPVPMYADINMPAMMRLVIAVIIDNLANFFEEPAATAASAGS